MKKSLFIIVLTGLKECFFKYVVSIILGFCILGVSAKVDSVFQNLLLNICGGLFTLPVVFLSYDLYHMISTKKQREMITFQIDNRISKMFVRFMFMSSKFRQDFDLAVKGNPTFLDEKTSDAEKIFSDISSVRHNGFFIFSDMDDFCSEVNEILNSPLVLAYLPNKIISLISDFSLEYEGFLNELKLISKDDFICIDSNCDLGFTISEESFNSTKKQIHKIHYNAFEQKNVIYVANFPIYDEKC